MSDRETMLRELIAKLADDIWAISDGAHPTKDVLRAMIGARLDGFFTSAPADSGALRKAAELTIRHFKRNNASGNFQGDDEHECWTALEAALASTPTEAQARKEVPNA